MIAFDKAVLDDMYQLICESVGEFFEQVNKVLIEVKKQAVGKPNVKNPGNPVFIWSCKFFKNILYHIFK